MLYLIETGIDHQRLIAKGYRGNRPIISIKEIKKLQTMKVKEEAYQKNRRIEFKVISRDYQKK